MIIDSHCHLQFPQYNNDRDEMIHRALSAGVGMICVGTDYETSKQGIEIAGQYDGVWASVGLHPTDANQESGIKNYEELLNRPKVVAVGEVGLDYYRTTEHEKQKIQQGVFNQFIDLAIRHNKPLIIHTRDASKGSMGEVHSDAISILKSYFSNHNSGLRGVAHSFTGTPDEARQYLDLGFYLGFNGIITFQRAGRRAPGMYDEMIQFVPLDRIFLETDAPFLAPEPYRGQRNEPAYIIDVAKKLAEIKNTSLNEIIETTTHNSRKLFQI